MTARADGEVLKTVAAAAGKTFHIKTERGYWYANSTGSNISASKGDFSTLPYEVDFNTTTDMSRFTIVKNTNFNRYYLYNIETSKWVARNGDYLKLVEKPVYGDSIGFTATTGDRATTYPTCIYFGGQTANMYGISPVNREPDVFKWNDNTDEGNNSSIVVSGTISDADYSNLVKVVDDLFVADKVVSASPIADPSDFNGQAGKAYIIHNVSSNRNGYLHVDASGNITWKATLAGRGDVEFNNFVFTTVANGNDLVLKANNNEYIPNIQLTSILADGSNLTTTADSKNGAGVVTVAVKSGYKPTTLNFLVDGRYMNVNNNGGVTPWNNVNDGNGVWEFTPVENNKDFITSTINQSITCQNGTTGTLQYSSGQKFRNGQTIYKPTVDFLSDGTAIVNSSTTTVAVTERLPFEVITAGKDTVWYNLDLRNNSTPKWMSATSSGSVTLSTTFTDNNYSQWAFKGSSAAGIQLYNKGLGTTYTLKGTTTPTLTTASGNNNFIIIKNNDGFVLKTSRYNNNCMNDVNGSLGYWNHTNAPTDDGSTFRVFLPKGFYTMLNYQKATGADAAYGYLGLPADASNKTNVMGNDATVSLNDVVYIAPASAPSSSTVDPRYVTMQLQGKNIQGVSESTQVTVGDNTVSFMVTRPNVGYFAFGSAVSNATPGARSYLHTGKFQSYKVVGWSTDAEATSWQVSPAGAITMTATQVGGKYYATFYAPFAVKLSGAKAYTLTLNTDKTSATLNEVQLTNSILPKESAVLIIADGANYTVEPVIDATEKVSSILTGVSLAESWSSHENDLVLGYVNDKIGFYKWGTSNTLKNNRCYLPASQLTTTATAKGVVIDFGTVTAINSATLNPAKADGKIYNLQGQEVSRSYKGVVIKNGRKVIQ